MSARKDPTTVKAKPAKLKKRPPFECVALVLQGGGALGSYQAGVYEALAEIDLHPDWVAGISIGSINAAIIAGNAPDDRVKQLRGFWESITSNPLLDWMATSENMAPKGDVLRSMFNQMSAGFALLGGAPGFFEPRHPAPFFQPPNSLAATSFYDTTKLKATLEQFVDFDRLNNDGMRLSIGAVNVRSGNFVYFDNKKETIRPEHIMASGALPPGFAPIEIDGEFYWDGGLISNTPLQWVVDGETRQDTLAFQIDLWSAKGPVPGNIAEVAARQKEIQYSSRTRAGTDQFKRVQKVRSALAHLLPHVPPGLLDSEEGKLLKEVATHKVYNIVHLIYRTRKYESDSKDYEFSRVSMNEHWAAGYEDARITFDHKEIFERPRNKEGLFTFDLLRDDPKIEGGA